ncbi:uncharacterized protein PAC_00224 [Phialocephala subalpina]|uniref:Uncharacterized protein n=1 Tax=Phialocephala subalpina TaxID=576137 RepID=A0A1L7WC55_9HELO|nr:uncharacterized protein PAC_00224 [Phialocephala subalpina]
MRLLHAYTFALQEFAENEIPPYAILSHTWEKDEVSFQDMQEGGLVRKEGYRKIKYACAQALSEKLDYVWVDTCCIDKRSSSELSEAINSMFQWYRKAQTCYAYLVDVPPTNTPQSPNSPFCRSRWFTRGWALQELIAPRNVYFHSKDWTYLGSKGQLSATITDITGIDEASLSGGNLREASVARKMSWASKRVTTRKEDLAYCLLGIFGVNMPMLYGEGSKAFMRLQEEIIKESDDQSLFAWYFDERDWFTSISGVLANSPAAFALSGNILPCKTWSTSFPPSMTSKGLRIELPLYYHLSDPEKKMPFGLLSCQVENNFFDVLALPLCKRPTAKDEFSRAGMPIQVPETQSKNIELATIYIGKLPPLSIFPGDNRRDSFLVRRLLNPNSKHGYRLVEVYPSRGWNPTRRIISTYFASEGWLEMQVLMHFAADKPSSLKKPDFIVEVEFVLRKYKVDDPTKPDDSRAQCGVAVKPDWVSLQKLYEEKNVYLTKRGAK